MLHHPRDDGVTRAVYKLLGNSRKLSNGTHMWSTNEQWGEFGGVKRACRTASYWWRVS